VRQKVIRKRGSGNPGGLVDVVRFVRPVAVHPVVRNLRAVLRFVVRNPGAVVRFAVFLVEVVVLLVEVLVFLVGAVVRLVVHRRVEVALRRKQSQLFPALIN